MVAQAVKRSLAEVAEHFPHFFQDPVLRKWLQRRDAQRVHASDTIYLKHAQKLLSTLPMWAIQRQAPLQGRGLLPLLYHFMLFPPLLPESKLRDDGTELTSSMTPHTSVPLQRKWCGGSVDFVPENPLRIGDYAHRESAIESVQEKKGNSGAVNLFVTQAMKISNKKGLALTEKRCHVYSAPGDQAAGFPPLSEHRQADFSETFTPTPISLFRFSAVTFNAHRIHYDHDYATQIAKMRGPLVHAPLNALLLWSLAERNGLASDKSRFSYRATAPLAVGDQLEYCGTRDGQLWVSVDGHVGMRGEIASADSEDVAVPDVSE